MKEYKRILLPLDFSKPCVYAAERAKELAEKYRAELTVLHIIDYLPPTYLSAELPEELTSKKLLIKKATAHAKRWMIENGLEHCKTIIEIGQPKKAIIKKAREQQVDLVILTPHGDNPLMSFFGSVTNAVAQNTMCDVFILRA